MRAVIYARYSEGPRQTDQSIEGQVADCTAYAQQHGMDIIGLYADRHISGKSVEGRDEFIRMMHDADHHRFDAIIVWKIDRFGRNREDIALNKVRLKKAGVQLHYAKEALPDGPEGILLEALLEGLAEYYSEDLRQKIVRGITESAKKGRMVGGTVPIGYRRTAEGTLEIDPEGAAAVREVYRLHNAGASLDELRQATYDAGIRNRKGGMVSTSVIHRMLRNERYLGTAVIQGVEVPIPPIIDQETFDEAAKHFKTSRHNGAGKAMTEYLLSCKCYCEKCGKMLRGVSATSHTGKIYNYYRCPGKCIPQIPKDKLEDIVVEHTIDDILTDEMIGILADKVMRIQEAEAEAEQDPSAQLKKDLAAARKKQKNLIEAIEAGGGASLVERLNEVESRIDELTVQVEAAKLKRPIIPKEIIRGWMESFRSGDRDDPNVRRKMLDAFVAAVEVGEDAVTIAYNTTEKEPHTFCLRSSNWKLRNGTQNIMVKDGYILLRVPLSPRERIICSG